METIHFKTVDPVSQDLLRGASQKGLSLNWERYEKQQPQDGFLRLGLCCPYGCMQGPCRIDPYGRGAQRGICGLDRDAMVAALLLRLALQGVLETGYTPAVQGDRIVWPASLDKKASAALKRFGKAPLSLQEVTESAAMLSRPGATPAALIVQALRLCLLGVALAGQNAPTQSASMGCRIGYGLFAGKAIRIALTGRIPAALVQSLQKQASRQKKPEVRLLSLGDWIPAGDAFLPIACTSGEAETVLSSGGINLLLAGPGSDPGLADLCMRTDIPVVTVADHPDAAAVIAQARTAFERPSPSTFAPEESLVSEARVRIGQADIAAALKGAASAKIALIGGADTLFQSFGHLPVEMAKALIGENMAVAAWGDAALWMIKQDLPATVLEAKEGPLAAVKALAAAGKLARLKGVCFTGLRDCRDFILALGLAALGLKVLVAVPLPLWGSEVLLATLRESLASTGGILAHFDHPAMSEEILDWFLRA
jgi:hypothetical protein